MGIKNFIVKDWSRTISLIIGAMGLIVGMYSLYSADKKAEPALVLNPTRTVVIDKANLKDAPIKVIRKDGTVVNESVSSATLYFWNNGDKAIHANEILEPIRVFFVDAENIEILDVKLLSMTRPVVKAAISRITNPKPEIGLDFFILEPNDGFSFQIIYAGDPSVKIDYKGVIEGASILTNEEIADSHFWTKLKGSTLKFGFVILILFLIMSIPASLLTLQGKLKPESKMSKIISGVLISFLVSFISISLYAFYDLSISGAQRDAYRDVSEAAPAKIRSQ